MALSNLITEKLEVFGGIDLKRNYQKYFSNALGISIGLHLLVILFYLGWTWLSDREDNVPHIRIHSIAELAPPPSTQDQPQDAAPVAPPPPSADVVRPNLGVPVPVPDAVAPQVTLPDMNEQAPVAQVPGNNTVTDLVKNDAPVQLNIKQPVEEAEPDKDAFVDVSEEPNPVIPIEKLIQYPEVAKRSNLEGKVVVEALISKDGTVEKVNIVKADYDIFKDAALEAMRKAKFTPARQNGTPLRLWITRTINFKLK
jgi:protein TonB